MHMLTVLQNVSVAITSSMVDLRLMEKLSATCHAKETSERCVVRKESLNLYG